ncbi:MULTISPECIES: hypothetical protein [unclassified Streptomyces]|uniref:hypothetical protein n=1 Tax=unclassified Streptomyces TaxID=2593676 RepID=UPI0011613039|nr:hypothetical protein [Streptomyces sp. TSRI0281]
MGELVAVYEYTDLDTAPTSRTRNSGGDLQASWGQPKGNTVTAYFSHDVQGVELEPGTKVTPESCAARVSTHGVDNINVETGTRFCILTNGGRAALLEVKSVDAGEDEFIAQATVWEK